MSLDLLESLRRSGQYWALCAQAADEIERLHTENQAIKDAYEHLAEVSKSQRETMVKYLFPEELTDEHC